MKVKDLEISKKQNNSVFKIYSGKEIKDNYEHLCQTIFKQKPRTSTDKRYFIFSDKENLDTSKKYYIFSISKEFLFMIKPQKYLYEVDLIDNERYTQSSNQLTIVGKVIKLKRWNLFFNYSDYCEGRKKNTFFNFIDEIGYDYNCNVLLEAIAVMVMNYELLANVLNLKCRSNIIWGEEEDTFYNGDHPASGLEKLKNFLIHSISNKNSFKKDLIAEISAIKDIKDFYNYFKENIDNERLTDENLKMYMLDNDSSLFTPINLIGGNATLQFENCEFNSLSHYLLIYNSYRESVLILKGMYENIYINKTYNGDPIKCDLYFPILMNFRQSIEIFFKSVYLNKILRKENIPDKEICKHLRNISFDDIKYYEEKPTGLNTHNLLVLLEFIKDEIEDKDFYEFLYNLSSFIYYAENTDPSFSRYIINKDYNFEKCFNIRIWYVDLINYINEFYYLVDNYYKELMS